MDAKMEARIEQMGKEIEKMGKEIEHACKEAYKAMKAGNKDENAWYTARMSGMLDMVEVVFGREQRDHMAKEASTRVREMQIRGQI